MPSVIELVYALSYTNNFNHHLMMSAELFILSPVSMNPYMEQGIRKWYNILGDLVIYMNLLGIMNMTTYTIFWRQLFHSWSLAL
jgi:hypothetical protein